MIETGNVGRKRHVLGSMISRLEKVYQRLIIPFLSVFLAFVCGGIVIILSDQEVVNLWRNVGHDPLSAFKESWTLVFSTYGALLAGSIGQPIQIIKSLAYGESDAIVSALGPISETLLSSTPLILAGLAVALGFHAGLFNIGAEGQIYVGALTATYVGFSFPGLPAVIHVPLAIAAGVFGGAVWGFIPGILKARTGAHEVIVTMMLNFAAFRLVDLFLKQPFYQRAGRNDPVSKIIEPSAEIPRLFDGLRVNWGVILALGVVILISWLLYRSIVGFEFRAVGLNMQAARVAGINTNRTIVLALTMSGALAGMAGAFVILGVNKALLPGFSPGYGWDAIAIAFLGGLRPWGIVLASLLFGALHAGATPMQASTGVHRDIIVVIQAFVIIFVAAPILVRSLFRVRIVQESKPRGVTKGWGS